MIKKIHHLGIAVQNLDAAVKVLEDTLGVKCQNREVVESQKAKVAFIPIGESRLELLEPTSEDSTIGKFLAQRGEGFHHLALESDDVASDLKKAEAGGARLIDKEPRPGAHGTKVGFLHPKSTLGVLIELVEEH